MHDIKDLSCTFILGPPGRLASSIGFAIRPSSRILAIHFQKHDLESHLKDPDVTWDFLSQSPESVHQLMITFSDRRTPLGDHWHHMHAYSGHTLKLLNAEGKFHYVQIHFRKEGGFRTIDSATATKLVCENPNYGI